jgi:hypothetical protein
MNIKGALEDTIEKVEEGVVSQAKTITQSAKGQITGNTSRQASSDHGTNESGHGVSVQQSHADQQANRDFVKDLYAPSEQSGSGGKKEPSEFVKDQLEAGKTPEEAMQLQSLRKKLHDETYYIPLTQRKSHEQEVQEEEQKKEEQQMEDLQKDEEKKQKDQPIAVQMGANKAERFPGASG